ncbi:unnamed protein product [Clonostachys byssicola]|uniref:Tat pathway signal sequence n=1 Tax=Clonostachys byssicola TaxID=160290 RepID=A0A9N9XYT0_9HYPO|nr:unnamed protein product [Clonostachys byssicola]
MAKEEHHPLVEGQDVDSDEYEDGPESSRSRAAWSSRQQSRPGPWLSSPVFRMVAVATILVLFIVVAAVIGLQFLSLSQRPSPPAGPECAARTSMWSPVLRDIPMKYAPVDFNGSFMHENIYRQVGSPEVDAAWEALGVDYRAGAISYEDGLASGLDESYAQRSPQYGGGFIVNVEGMHHLHCLNLVRKALYFNYDHYRELGHHAFKNDEYILRLHVTHCLDTIRQVLMCNVDTGVLGQVWVDPEKPNAFPDFNTRHMCKDYDAVRRWAKDLQAPPLEEVPGDFLAPPIYGGVMPNTP